MHVWLPCHPVTLSLILSLSACRRNFGVLGCRAYFLSRAGGDKTLPFVGHVAVDQAVAHHHQTASAGGHIWFMGDQDDGLPKFPVQPLEFRQDFLAGA